MHGLVVAVRARPIIARWAAAMVMAPAAEALRKPRRVGDDDFADMVILRGRGRSFRI